MAKPHPPPSAIRIQVFPDKFVVNERDVTAAQLAELLRQWAGIDKHQTVLIMCASATPHEKLVEVLDTCANAELSNLSVVSSGG